MKCQVYWLEYSSALNNYKLKINCSFYKITICSIEDVRIKDTSDDILTLSFIVRNVSTYANSALANVVKNAYYLIINAMLSR